MLEFSFLVDIISNFIQPYSLSYQGTLNKSECQKNCDGIIPLPSKIQLFRVKIKSFLGDIPLLMELEGVEDFESLESYSLHIRGKYV